MTPQPWTVEHLNGHWRLMEEDTEIFSHVHVGQEALKKIADRHNQARQSAPLQGIAERHNEARQSAPLQGSERK